MASIDQYREKKKMQEIRKVAKAYFEGQKEDDKQLAVRFFRSIDQNGDGKVSLDEYKRHVDSNFSSEHVFKKLDANGDGTLDFEEVVTLYYMDNVLMPRCSACHVMLLTSSYFSCLPCLGKTSYHLCCSCYGGARFHHRHQSTEFADTRALLKLMDALMTGAEMHKEVEKGGSSSVVKSKQSSPISTESRTATIVSKLAVCATKTIIIKGVASVAVASGCCIM